MFKLKAVLLTAVFSAMPALAANNDAPPDAWLTAKSKLTLITKGELKSNQVHVDATEGVVTLYGKVKNQNQKQMAETAVKEIKGVRSVNNLLQIVPEATEKTIARKDDDIADQAKKMIKEDPALNDSKVEVKSVDKGVVLLTGKAATFSDQLRAVSDVDQIGGVKKVVSQIEAPDAYGYTERNLTFDKEPKLEKRTSMSDTGITANVKMKLLTTSGVPSTDVNVDTNDGVVTLFGMVPTIAAKDRAEAEAAKVGGVIRVHNQLEVVSKAEQKEVAAKDDDIKAALKDRFGKNPDYKDVKFEVANATVQLTGTVPNAWVKLETMRIARTQKGVKNVNEQLELKPTEKRADGKQF
ncbi:MAG: BON domain-containing protein [Archangiaceae bacterium]|nr:BON domain-containing protein [Archangiaceae bacterium]